MKRVKLHLNGHSIPIRNRKRLYKFIEFIFRKEGSTLKSLAIILYTDAELLKLNRKFLGHNYFTDVITFDLGPNENVEGEVYISISRVKENASAFFTTFSEEIIRVIFHGVLHLCGYTDQKKSEQKVITQIQESYITLYKKIAVPRGTSNNR